MGKRPGLGCCDLSAVLTKLRRHIGEAKRVIDGFFGFAGDEGVVRHPIQAVLVQLEATLDGPVSQNDVVSLRSGEVLERRPGARARDQPEIRLESTPEDDARLGASVREHPLDLLVSGKDVDQAVGCAGSEDIQIAAGLTATPQAADHGDRG